MNDLDKSILKVLFTNKKYATEFATECSEKLFESDSWRFAKAVIDYVRVNKDVPTRRTLLEKIRTTKNEVFYRHAQDIITEIENYQYNDIEYRHDLEKLKTRFAEKLILSIKDSLNNSATIDVKKSITDLQSVITTVKSINEVKAYTQQDLKESLSDFKERYLLKKKNPNISNGILTGYTFLDYITDGIPTSTLSLICGHSGSGKSTLLMNMCINMWLNGNSIYSRKDFKEGHDVLFFSLEMPFALCQERVLSRLAMVPQKSIKHASLNDDEVKQLSTAMNFIESYPYNFDIVDLPRNSTLETMEMIYNDIASRKRPPKVVIVDYLSLMSVADQDVDVGDWLQLGKSAEKLHEFSRVYSTAVLSAVQLNEPKPGAKHSDENFGLGAVSRSRMINHNADLILSIERREKENERPDFPLHIIKSRNTEHGKGTLYKNFGCCAILNNPAYEDNRASDLTDISDRISQFTNV
jgi:replicative DNA helicase